MAELATTTSAPAMFSARCPSNTLAPRLARRCGDGGALEIGAGDLVAEVQQHLGDAAHADAADADKMDALNFGEHLGQLLRHGFTRMHAKIIR